MRKSNLSLGMQLSRKWFVELQTHLFLISALDGDKWWVSSSVHCIPWEKLPIFISDFADKITFYWPFLCCPACGLVTVLIMLFRITRKRIISFFKFKTHWMYTYCTLYFTSNAVLTHKYAEIGSVKQIMSAKQFGMMVKIWTSVGKVHGFFPY
jgi:hypothetical protein